MIPTMQSKSPAATHFLPNRTNHLFSFHDRYQRINPQNTPFCGVKYPYATMPNGVAIPSIVAAANRSQTG
jgi:hypothetical protein